MFRSLPVLLALLALSGCTTTHLGTVGFDASGRPVPIPGIGIGGDVVGDVDLTINGHGSAVIRVVTPPGLTQMPVIRQAVLNRKGTEILGYNEIPMMTGIYHGRTNDSIWSGIARSLRSASNLVGTFFTGLMGWETAKRGVANTLAPQ